MEFNLFKAATGDPETISVKSSDNIVRYNTYRATNGEITLRHGNRNLVYGNFMLSDGLTEARGMRVLGADHRIFNNYIEGITRTAGIFLRGGTNAGAERATGTDFYRVYRTHIVNNTLVDGRGIAVGSTDMPPLDCVVANNIVQNSSGAAIVNVGQGTKIEGNIVFPMGAGATAGVMAGSRMIDPKLMQVDGVFRISMGSPAIDAALGAYDLRHRRHGRPPARQGRTSAPTRWPPAWSPAARWSKRTWAPTPRSGSFGLMTLGAAGDVPLCSGGADWGSGCGVGGTRCAPEGEGFLPSPHGALRAGVCQRQLCTTSPARVVARDGRRAGS